MLYSERLKYLREEKELKQYELSEYLGLHEYVYGQYEREEDLIPIKHLNSLCNYFKISLDYIFNFTSIKNYSNTKKEINIELSSQRLKEFRKENNLTQEKLSNILKIDHSTISKYENGKNIITTTYLYEICKKYNISADYLLGKIDKPKYLK